LDRFLESRISGSPENEMLILTRPRFRVISRTKWEVNITRKYRVASSAMVLKTIGILSPHASDFIARTTITENARRSDPCAFSAESVFSNLNSRRFPRTIEEGDADSRDF
jgi:hypothetical protein